MGVQIGADSQAANSVEMPAEYAQEKQVPKKQVPTDQEKQVPKDQDKQVPKDQGDATQVATRVNTGKLHKARSDFFCKSRCKESKKKRRRAKKK